MHFGEQVLESILTDKSLIKTNFESESQRKKLIEIIYDKIYENLIREIDAIDNGISIADEQRYYFNKILKLFPM